MPATMKKAPRTGTAGGSLSSRRALAKAGMTVSLGLLLVTAFTGTRRRTLSRAVHLWSGAALAGFSLWHHALYPAKAKRKDPS